MKKIIAMMLAVSMILLTLIFCISCTPSGDPEPESPPSQGPEEPEEPDEGGNDGEGGEKYDSAGIIIPEYRDYGRGTKDFSILALDYARPDVSELCAAFDAVTELINANISTFDEQVAAIASLEGGYELFSSMYAVAEIYTSKDTAAKFWADEYEYLSSSAPSLTGAAEDLYVACANSPYARDFEEQYFGFDISEYKDGGKYTDAALEFMSTEAILESEYKALSPSTVIINYVSASDNIEGTYEDVLAELKDKYGASSKAYSNAATVASMLYNNAYQAAATDIYIELLKVRSLLATELGYESYAELGYEKMGYTYTSDDMLDYLAEIGKYVVPVYTLLYSYELSGSTPKWSTSTLVNNSYRIASSLGSEYGEAFSYMLQHGLYDISPSKATRLDASFTTYISSNSSPYLFVTTTGYVSDFSTLMHEFGHFMDGYVNNGEGNSLETAELCSQGLELLALTKLGNYTSASVLDQMAYAAFMTSLEVLWYQGVLSMFEHLAYAIPYESINRDTLEAALAEAEDSIFGSFGMFTLTDVLQIHLYVAPMYVQSYCTSILPAIELYLLELDNAGAGFAAYNKILHRSEDDFLSVLSSASLSSPFAEGSLSRIIGALKVKLAAIVNKYP